MIEPEVSGQKQLDEGIADTLVSDSAANDFCLVVLGNVGMRESVRSFYLTSRSIDRHHGISKPIV